MKRELLVLLLLGCLLPSFGAFADAPLVLYVSPNPTTTSTSTYFYLGGCMGDIVNGTVFFGDGGTEYSAGCPGGFHTYTYGGSYSAYIAVGYGNGSILYTPYVTVTVTGPPPPTLPVLYVTPNPTSVGYSSFFYLGGTGDIINGTIYFGDGASEYSAGIALAFHAYSDPGTYEAYIAVGYGNGSVVNTANVSVVVNGVSPIPPVLYVDPNPTNIVTNTFFYLGGTGSINNVTYFFGDGANDSELGVGAAFHVYIVAGTYTANASVTYSNGTTVVTPNVQVVVSNVGGTTPEFQISVAPIIAPVGWQIRVTPAWSVPGATLANITYYFNGSNPAFSYTYNSTDSVVWVYFDPAVYTIHAVALDTDGNSYISNSIVVTITTGPITYVHLSATPYLMTGTHNMTYLSFVSNGSTTFDNVTIHWGDNTPDSVYFSVDSTVFSAPHVFVSYVNKTFHITANIYINGTPALTDSAAFTLQVSGTVYVPPGSTSTEIAPFTTLIMALIFMLTPAVLFWTEAWQMGVPFGGNMFLFLMLEGMVLGGFIGMEAGYVPLGVWVVAMVMFGLTVWRR